MTHYDRLLDQWISEHANNLDKNCMKIMPITKWPLSHHKRANLTADFAAPLRHAKPP